MSTPTVLSSPDFDRREFVRTVGLLSALTVISRNTLFSASSNSASVDPKDSALRVHVSMQKLRNEVSQAGADLKNSWKSAKRSIDLLRRLETSSPSLEKLGELTTSELSAWAAGKDFDAEDMIQAAVVAKVRPHVGELLVRTGYVDQLTERLFTRSQKLLTEGSKLHNSLQSIARDPFQPFNAAFLKQLPGFDLSAKTEFLLYQSSDLVQRFHRNVTAFKAIDWKNDWQGAYNLARGMFASVLGAEHQKAQRQVAAAIGLVQRVDFTKKFTFEKLDMKSAIEIGGLAAGALGIDPEKFAKVTQIAGMVAAFSGYGNVMSLGGGAILSGAGGTILGGAGSSGPDPQIMAALAELKKLLEDVVKRLQRIETKIDRLSDQLADATTLITADVFAVRDVVLAGFSDIKEIQKDKAYDNMAKKLDQAEQLNSDEIQERGVKIWIEAFGLIAKYCTDAGNNDRAASSETAFALEATLLLTPDPAKKNPSVMGLNTVDRLFRAPAGFRKINTAFNNLFPAMDVLTLNSVNPLVWANAVDRLARAVLKVKHQFPQGNRDIEYSIKACSRELRLYYDSGRSAYDTCSSNKAAAVVAEKVRHLVRENAEYWMPLGVQVEKAWQKLGEDKLFTAFPYQRIEAPRDLSVPPGAKISFPTASPRVTFNDDEIEPYFLVGLNRWATFRGMHAGKSFFDAAHTGEPLFRIEESSDSKFAELVGTVWRIPGRTNMSYWLHPEAGDTAVTRCEVTFTFLAHDGTPEGIPLRLLQYSALIYPVPSKTKGGRGRYPDAEKKRMYWWTVQDGMPHSNLADFVSTLEEKMRERHRRALYLKMAPVIAQEFSQLNAKAQGAFHEFLMWAGFANFILAVRIWRSGGYPMTPLALSSNAATVAPQAIGHPGDVCYAPKELASRMAHHLATAMTTKDSATWKKWHEAKANGAKGAIATKFLRSEILQSLDSPTTQENAVPHLGFLQQFAGADPETTIPPLEIGLAKIEFLSELINA